MVFEAMHFLVSNDLARFFTFDGMKGKRAFKDLRIAKFLRSKSLLNFRYLHVEISNKSLVLVILVAVKRVFPSAATTHIGQRVGRWLTLAKHPKTQKKRRLCQFEAADFEEF